MTPMTRREAWLTALGIFVLAVVVRSIAAAATTFPRPEDTAYYVGVARNLVEGRGLVSDSLWSFQTPPLVFPRPAFEVWLPLPSLLFAIPLALSGAHAPITLEQALRAAQVVGVLAGGLLAVLAWRLAADVAEARALPTGRARTLAIGTGLTVAVYLPLVLHAAQPDSTLLFGMLALAACLLMTRLLRDPRGASVRDPRLWALGVLLGATALTRNEAAWLALTWAALAWFRRGTPLVQRFRLVAVAAAAAIVVFAPWAARDWAVFGTPLPGQAAANALSVTGFDIFAWNDPPTLARYLAVGPARLLEMRLEGLDHNLWSVLLLLGIPLSVLGVAALPWQARDRALRPLVIVCLATFTVTSLAFPVATTWGTYLHAAAPAHVLVVIAALGALDGGFARLAARMRWERPVAWLGVVLAVGAGATFSAVLLPPAAADAVGTARQYEVLARQLAAAGSPLDDSAPVITDFPVWMAEAARIRTLALPDESPANVLDLARDPRFGAQLLVVVKEEHGRWPAVLDEAGGTGGQDAAAACFEEVAIPVPQDPLDAAAIESIRAFRIVCP